MNSMNKIVLACGVSGLALSLMAASPVIRDGSVTFSQDPSTRKVTIGYELQGAPAIVTVDILTNGVSIGTENLTYMAGDVNKRVAVGSRSVTWQPCKAWRGHVIKDGSVTAKVSAWALNEPPQYMVVDLTVPNSVRYFASEEEVPGGVSNACYKTDCLVLRKCPAENVVWRMGSSSQETGRIGPRETAHLVTLSNDFYIGVYPVTQRQYYNLKGKWPSYFTAKRDMRPVENLSFDDIRGKSEDGFDWPNDGYDLPDNSFLKLLRDHTGGIRFDLPLDAEWEFACRAGCGAALYDGKDASTDNIRRLGRTKDTGGCMSDGSDCPATTNPEDGGTTIVGSYEANDWHLYDMLGNVWEATRDWYQEVLDETVDPNEGPKTGTYRVFRGGSVTEHYNWVRSASRGPKVNSKKQLDFGFRVALTLAPDAIP